MELGVTCDVEMTNTKNINEVFERVLKSDVRYRFVIDVASLNASTSAS